MDQIDELEAEAREARPSAVLDMPASRVVHDFHNILCGILGCAEHALGVLPPDSSARADLEQICRVAESAASYGKTMLSTAHDAAAQNVRSFDIDDAVVSAECMLQRLVGDKIDFDLRLQANGACIWGEPSHIEQVLANLVINARQAMPNGGKLQIRTRSFGFSGYPRHAVLRVTDSGAGMDATTRARAFEPFFTSRREHGGTGLGLSNVHSLVRLAGGRVIVRNGLNSGTAFTIVWPCVARGTRERRAMPRPSSDPPRPVSIPPRRSSTPPTDAQTVLLVEDEALIALAAQHHLASAGYRVIVARNARQAQLLAVQHRGTIDVLLTDIALPGRGGGFDVARAVTSLHPRAVTVYMSAHPRSYLVRQGMLSPNAVAIEKPFTCERLVTTVQQAVTEAKRSWPASMPPPSMPPPSHSGTSVTPQPMAATKPPR